MARRGTRGAWRRVALSTGGVVKGVANGVQGRGDMVWNGFHMAMCLFFYMARRLPRCVATAARACLTPCRGTVVACDGRAWRAARQGERRESEGTVLWEAEAKKMGPKITSGATLACHASTARRAASMP